MIRKTAEKLLALANLESPPNDIVSTIQECVTWENECVTAFLSAWDKATLFENADRQSYFDALKKARHLLPVGKVNNTLQNRLANLEMKIVAWEKEHYEYQPIRDWPKPPQLPAIFPEKVAPFVQSIPGKRNPFAHEKAEEDLYYLFGFREGWASAFWGGHRLFNELFNVDRTTLVFGTQGNGRTTLAYALHYHAPQREVFALHLPGRPQPDEIRAGLITHLWDFVLTFPQCLRRLTPAQRQLMARLFVSIQSAESLRAHIEARQSEVYSAFPQMPASEKDNKDDIVARLQLLAGDVAWASSLPMISDSFWPGDVSLAAQAVGFARVLLVLDSGCSDDDIIWFRDCLWPHLLPWQRQGLFTVLFLPDDDELKDITAGLYNVYRRWLLWNPEQLERMLTWRYKSFAGPRQALQQHFEEDAFDYLLSQSSRPDSNTYSLKVFSQLWQQILEQMPSDELISKENVKYALKMIEKEAQPVIKSVKKEERTAVKEISASIPEVENATLRQILINYFNESELRNLCFDLSVEDEEIFSRQSISDFAREMIKYFERRGRFSELVKEVYRRRPKAFI